MRRSCVALALVAVCALSATSAFASTDRLVGAIKSRNLNNVVAELQNNVDVNQPSSSRALPLVEAVKTGDLRIVNELLGLGALAKSVEPGSGTTPLHAAFQGGHADIARALLAHGADLNVRDKSGVAARAIAPADIVSAYDAKGALAFEAAPGSWLKEIKDGRTYYWSPSTNENRWHPPPSCAWHRVTVQGHPFKYVNTISGQETTKVPPALAWTKTRAADGTELWLNWAAKVSSIAQPAELPDDLAAELARTVNQRWYNAATGEFSYTDPAYSTAWRELRDDSTGSPYWFNVETGATVWEAPEELAWTQMTDTDGRSYWHNARTNAVSWTATSGPHSYTKVQDL